MLGGGTCLFLSLLNFLSGVTALPQNDVDTSSVASATTSAATPAASQDNPDIVRAGYPSVLRSSKPSAFHLAVKSNNPLTNGKNIQLRPRNLQGSEKRAQAGETIVVIDNDSPVLLAQLVDGVLCSFATNAQNDLFDLGPTADLRNGTDVTPTSAVQEFFFVDNDNPTGGFRLDLISVEADYALYHQEKPNVVNGFLICDQGTYHQVFYNTYTQPRAPKHPGCEFIGLETTVAPVDLGSQPMIEH